jgi:SAM-dependent methyltransferase
VTHYDEDLAYTHEQGYSGVAEDAAAFVLGLLRPGSTVVELGCGPGVTARRLLDAGHDVVGIDQSAALIALARRRAPEATFVVGSFVTSRLPDCDAVLAIGEVFNYLFDERNTRAALPGLFARIHAALRPGGRLVFDLASPAVRRGHGARVWNAGADWATLVENDESGDILARRITTFRKRGSDYRRTEELHRQRLYRPGEILPLLRAAGFRARTSRGYSAGPGRHIYVARKPGSGEG